MIPLNFTYKMLEALEDDLMKRTPMGWDGPPWLRDLRQEFEQHMAQEVAQQQLDDSLQLNADIEYLNSGVDVTSLPWDPQEPT